MMDLLEILLNGALECLCAAWDWEGLWRFLVPVLGAIGVLLLIRATVSNSMVQILLGVPVAILGVLTGLVWHTRKG